MAAAAVAAPIAKKVFSGIASKVLGNIFGNDERPVTLRRYDPNTGEMAGWNWGDYGLGTGASEEQRNLVDSLLRQNANNTYRSQADMFKYSPQRGGPTGEASFYDKDAQRQDQYDKSVQHNMNALYRQMQQSGDYGAMPDAVGNPYAAKTEARDMLMAALGLSGEQGQPTDQGQQNEDPVADAVSDEINRSIINYGDGEPVANTWTPNVNHTPVSFDFNKLNQPVQLPGKEGLNTSVLRSTALRNILKNSGNLRG